MSVRAPGVPLWVTILAVVLGLFATAIGVITLLDPTTALGYVSGADELATTWGGRNAGLGAVLLIAVYLRSPAGYVVAFSGQVSREVGDLFAAAPEAAGVAFTAVFLLLDLLGLTFSVRAMRRQGCPELQSESAV